MKSFIKDFKAFAVKGNVIDLAAAVVIGTAFGSIVSSLVANIIMPFVGILMGGIDFTDWSFSIGEATIGYGHFLQASVNFLIIALVIFLVVKVLARLKRDGDGPVPLVPKEPSDEVKLLIEIRDSLQQRKRN